MNETTIEDTVYRSINHADYDLKSRRRKEVDIATAIKDELCSLREKVSHFAQQNIAHRSDLHTSNEFPYDIWHLIFQPL